MSDMSDKSDNLVERVTIRVPKGFMKRLKVAAAEEDLPAGLVLSGLLDARAKRMARRRAAMPGPLHRPVGLIAYDDD